MCILPQFALQQDTGLWVELKAGSVEGVNATHWSCVTAQLRQIIRPQNLCHSMKMQSGHDPVVPAGN